MSEEQKLEQVVSQSAATPDGYGAFPITQQMLQQHWQLIGLSTEQQLQLQQALDRGGIQQALLSTFQVADQVLSSSQETRGPLGKRVLRTGADMSTEELRITFLEEIRPHTEAIITWVFLFLQSILRWCVDLPIATQAVVFMLTLALLYILFRFCRRLLAFYRRNFHQLHQNLRQP